MSDAHITIGKYQGVPVGQGGFATVFCVKNQAGNHFALKLVDPSADDAIRESLYHEYTVQSELIHPQVVRAHDFGLFDGRPYIVLDWVDGKSFFEQFPTPSSDDFVTLLRQLVRGLYFIHHRSWVHGDLKPENLLWSKCNGDGSSTEPLLRILDFGLARPVGDADRPRGAGTIGYCAPEFLNNQPADGRADWYSAGIILYEWIFGRRPYAADEPAIEIAGHLEGVPVFELPQHRPAPEWATELIARLLAKTADDRAVDEPSLLAFMAEFDPTLEPAGLLNEQLMWHARSEAYHLRLCEQELLNALHADLTGGLPARWNVQTHGTTSHAWLDRAAAVCSLLGYEVSVQPQANNDLILSDRQTDRDCESRVFIKWSSRPTSGSHPTDGACFRSVTLLQWNRDNVREYLYGVVGDDDVAEAWTDVIHHATCGLPCAVRDLLDSVIDSGAMTIDPDGWALDESAVTAWMKAHAEEYVVETLGAFDSTERHMCEWFALAEGFASRPVLNKVWRDPDPDTVLHSLAARGVIVGSVDSYDHNFGMQLRLLAHDEILRSQMDSGQIRDRSLLLAETLEQSSVEPAAMRAAILAHAFNRAEVWDKAAGEFLGTATFAIKADDRERAMRYILMAQDSAKRIGDERLRSHWLGHARMVEADLQKSAGQLEVSRQIYRELLALSRVTGDQRLLAETLHDLGDLYRITRFYDKGIRAERRARRIWETLGDRAELSRTLNSLGNLSRIAGDLPMARTYYTEALTIQRELGLDRYAATNLNNIGLIYWQEYDLTEAQKYFHEALEIQERLNVPVEVARVLNNLGAINFVQGLLNESKDNFHRAAAINSSAGAESEALYNQRNLAEVALEEGDLRTAVTLGQQVHRGCQELGDVSTQAEVAAILADAYLRAGDYRSALRFHREASNLSASLKNEELRVYLDLQNAARAVRFGRRGDAARILDCIMTADRSVANRYQYLDALISRLQIACSAGDRDMALRLSQEGLAECGVIGAPHKAIQLLHGRVSACPGLSDSGDAVSEIESFLSQCPNWHWAGAHHLWAARNQFHQGQLDSALEKLQPTITQIRSDGCWELLWRALVLQAEICHARADYEPAMRALEEADRMLKVVVTTVEDETERSVYIESEDARTLKRIQERITQLVS
jgi:tetratricopeptide (TPR) repeat protein